MYLSTLTIGYAVPPRSFEAVVHSVFQSAANLRLTTSGKLLTLVTASDADLPQGLRLETPAGFSFSGFQMGERVTCRNGLLRLDTLSLTVDLTKARRWKCDLPTLKTDLTNPAVESAWKAVWQALNQRQQNVGADIIADDLLGQGKTLRAGIPQKAAEAVQALTQSTQQLDLTATPPIHELIGLGSGLTPAGDDLLVGYLAGLWCVTDGKSERQEFVSSLGKRVVRLSRQTNDISRTYLYHAAHGQVSSRLADLSEAISGGEIGKPLLAIAENAMRVGHTSGMDAVTGLLLGLAAWNQPIF
jgi:hypothetical protein